MLIKDRAIRCIFLGEDSFSLEVLRSVAGCSDYRFVILAVVILDKKNGVNNKLIRYCEANCIRYFVVCDLGESTLTSYLRSQNYDFIVSAHFSRLIPMSLVRKAKVAALNLHPSLLPKYRGMSPQHWPIVLGDSETGVTVHCMEEDADTGRIIEQTVVPISKDMYVYDLQRAFIPVYRKIMIASMRKVLSGFTGISQNIEKGSYYHTVTRGDMNLEDRLDVFEAYRMVRAFSFPYSGAFFRGYRIMEAMLMSKEEFDKFAERVNEPKLVTRDGRMTLVFSNGGLWITRWIES